MRSIIQSFVGLALSTLVLATPMPSTSKGKVSFVKRDGVTSTVFDHPATNSRLDFVTNSGICETTPGVNQHSGYIKVGDNLNMWFWFFESRNSPSTAPLAVWLNGGPGCSSMIGLFQENGPCHFVNGSTEPSLNPNSWNSYANMLYIDQPIGTGFSYGDVSTNSTVTAAPYVWKFMQAFYDLFPTYENRDFGLFTESYGGHYGPEFASYFTQQNKAIDAGTVKGDKIKLVALGVNNGWIDALTQYKAYIDFSAKNKYKQLLSSFEVTSYTNTYNNRCAPAVKKCLASGTNADCSTAERTCYNGIEGAIANSKDFDVYDVRAPSDDPNPPKTYSDYLGRADVKKAIGATSTYQECGNDAYAKFASTGDNTRSFTKRIGDVVSSGVRTLIWAGDADWICNYMGVETIVNQVSFPNAATFQSKALAPFKVKGTEQGLFKSVDNLSYLRVYGAGHEVPYYQPELALQVFIQTMQNKPISST